MILTTYYSKLGKLPANYTPVQISNSAPPGLYLPKWVDVIPPWTLVQEYKQSGDWNWFRTKYLAFLDSKHPVCIHGDVALVCWEKDAAHCHRSLLAQWLQHTYQAEVLEL